MNIQDQIINLLTDSWPEGCSITKMVNTAGIRRAEAENETLALVTAGRISASFHGYYAAYRLTHDEAVKQGIDMTPKVKSRTHDVYKLEPLKFKPMQPVRPDAEEAMRVLSRRGDEWVPFMPPMHMGSKIPGGML